MPDRKLYARLHLARSVSTGNHSDAPINKRRISTALDEAMMVVVEAEALLKALEDAELMPRRTKALRRRLR